LGYVARLRRRPTSSVRYLPGSTPEPPAAAVEVPAAPDADIPTSYEEMRKADLLEVAKAQNLDVDERDTKAEIIDALRSDS
jgi:hypothetical protein